VSERWRRWALYLFLLGVVGVAAELYLLEHFEDPAQWTPLALLAVGLVSALVAVVRPSAGAVWLLRVVAVGFVLVAGLGIYFHIRSNVEFELELRPTMGGMELVWESLKGAMPALAPGAMAQLGLLGLLATFKHPLLINPGLRPGEPSGGRNKR
jgi:hypothetical protein